VGLPLGYILTFTDLLWPAMGGGWVLDWTCRRADVGKYTAGFTLVSVSANAT